MEPGPTASDRDARLLGLALLHGYVEADQLQRAAEANSSPSSILAELRRSGAIDDPCLAGLEHALKDFQSGSAPGKVTAPTHMEPPRHLSATADGAPGQIASAEDEAGLWNSGARLLSQFTVAQWKHYRNLRFIGEGGMGRIYRAQDPDLKRTVALKFLRGQDLGQLKRFLFEAQAQALMEHPNICRVYEISEWQGQHYIAMQYVNGPTLLRAASTLDFEEKLRIGEVIAEAVHAAHRRGLIHRDLKPANVLLEKGEDGHHKPYVLDFGLAREMEAPGMTASGLVLGTTAYISPEQARGEAHHVDRRTDVYGLGATLYELFAGCPPFGECSGMECIRKVLDEEPPSLRSLAPQLPKDLETVVMKCLEKDPARRYDDARSLAEDLRRVREGEPIQARPASLVYRIRRFAAQNRALVVVSSVAAAGFLILIGIAGYTRITAAVRERHAQNFSQQAERIEALIRFAKLSPTQNIEPHEASCRDRLVVLQQQVKNAGWLAEGPGAYATGRAMLALGEVDQALRALRRAESSGQQSPELFYALGRCNGFVYRRELEQANRIEDLEERSARIHVLEAEWKTPALRYLQQAKGTTSEPPEHLEALVESFSGNLEAALVKAKSAARRNPLWYEARRLEGQILQALAQQHDGRPEAWNLLREASACFDESRRIAPSDSDLWLEDAKVHREMVRQATDFKDGEAQLRECRDAVEHCLSIRPSDSSPRLQVAWSIAFQTNRFLPPKQDPETLLKEGLTLVDRFLLHQPWNPEAHGVKTYLLEILGQAQFVRGQDPTRSYEAALECAREGLAKAPNDATLLSWAMQSAQALLIRQGSVGKDIEPTWALAKGWAERYRRSYPEQAFAHRRYASLHIERAEIERRHGQDPRPWIERALEAFQVAQSLGKEQPRMRLIAANAYLIRGQYDLVNGRDAASDLERAVGIYEKECPKPMPRVTDYAGLAECLLYRGLADIANGRDPADWIGRSESVIDQGMKLAEDYSLDQLLGQCHWAKACWAHRRGVPARRWFEKAEFFLRRSTQKGMSPDGYRWLAQVLADKATARLAGPEDFRRGIQAADQAIQLDPGSGEGYFLKARLLHSRGIQGNDARAARDRQDAETVHRRAGELDPGRRQASLEPRFPGL